jgi:polysaccharide export outer membrane protein
MALVCSTSSFAVSAPLTGGASSETNTAQSTRIEYRLTPGDTLTVLVFDQKDLSGDFSVDGVGQILLPVAGAIKVAGLTLPEVQDLIQESLAKGILVRPIVSVRIDKYRPNYINGDVKTPGSYPFQFGLTVNAIIAAAGGRRRVISNDPMSDFIQADERVRLLEGNRLELLVRKARLEAERDQRSRFLIPQPVSTGAPDPSAIYTSESDTFSRVMMTYRNQLDLLEKQKPRMEAEIQAVTEQLGRERERRELISTRISNLEQYQKKGLVQNHVVNDQQREQANVEAEAAKLKARIARLQTELGELDIKIEDAKAMFERRVLGDLQETLQQLRKIDATMGHARQLRKLRAQAISNGGKSDYSIRISRIDQTGIITFDATGDTLLQPGDVIDVQYNEVASDATMAAEADKYAVEGRVEASASAYRSESDFEPTLK